MVDLTPPWSNLPRCMVISYESSNKEKLTIMANLCTVRGTVSQYFYLTFFPGVFILHFPLFSIFTVSEEKKGENTGIRCTGIVPIQM